MKIKNLLLPILTLACMTSAQAEEFTGDVKLACEALLCLSSSTTPSECSPSLDRYFSINFKDFGDTLDARKAFLNMCPTASSTSQMVDLTNDIVNSAGRCDVASLNRRTRTITVRVWNPGQGGSRDERIEPHWQEVEKQVVNNVMPAYCTKYANNELTDVKQPVFIGDPESESSRWVIAP